MTITGLDQAVRIMQFTDRIRELEAALAETLQYIDQDSETPTEQMNAWFAVLAGNAPAPFTPETASKHAINCAASFDPDSPTAAYACSCGALTKPETDVNLCKHKGCKLSAGYGGEYCDEHL